MGTFGKERFQSESEGQRCMEETNFRDLLLPGSVSDNNAGDRKRAAFRLGNAASHDGFRGRWRDSGPNLQQKDVREGGRCPLHGPHGCDNRAFNLQLLPVRKARLTKVP